MTALRCFFRRRMSLARLGAAMSAMRTIWYAHRRVQAAESGNFLGNLGGQCPSPGNYAASPEPAATGVAATGAPVANGDNGCVDDVVRRMFMAPSSCPP